MSANEEFQDLFPDVTESQDITIKFNTTAHSLDAVLMANTLIALNDAISGIAKFDNIQRTKIEVKEVKSGCIEVGAIVSACHMAGCSLNYLATLWGNLKSLYELYTFLGGKPPQQQSTDKNGMSLVHNYMGNNNTFNNCVVNQYFSSSSSLIGNGKELLQDTKLSSVSVMDEKRHPLLEIPRESFSSLVPYQRVISSPDIKKDTQDCLLTIATVNLNTPRQNWKFIDHDGLPFSAKITDDAFISKVESGLIAFRQGDKIQCTLETVKEFDVSLNTLVIKKRVITHILDHNHRPDISGPNIFSEQLA